MTTFLAIAIGALVAGYLKAWRVTVVVVAILLALFGGGMAYDYVTIVRPCEQSHNDMPAGACIDWQAQMGLAFAVAAFAVVALIVGSALGVAGRFFIDRARKPDEGAS